MFKLLLQFICFCFFEETGLCETALLCVSRGLSLHVNTKVIKLFYLIKQNASFFMLTVLVMKFVFSLSVM